MQRVNEIIKHTQIDKSSKPEQPSKPWSVETEKMVLGLFARLGDLFQDLAKSKGLEIHDDKGNYTRVFELWCKKLCDLRPDQIASGVTNLEKRIEDVTKENDGRKVYPPTYSEFRGLCFISKTEKAMYRTWKGLPVPKMSNEDKKEAMKKLRGDCGL